MRHGDLWAGNVLAKDGRLTGVLDWDAWHPAGVPGADLLHYVAAGIALSSSLSLAELLLERPWRARPFREVAPLLWQALGIDADEQVLQVVGVAWWAGQMAQDLVRNPVNADDEDWVARNVEPLMGAPGLEWLERGGR
jgi:hypothetical protein